MLVCLNCFSQKKKFREYQTGELRLKFTLPYINHIALHPDKLFKENRFGFLGEALGFEYNYKTNKFLETSASLNATADIPFPVVIDKEYRKFIATIYFSLTDNIIKERFTVGYGINFAFNKWREEYNNCAMVSVDVTEYLNKTLGLTLNCYYRPGRTIHVGLIYRPSLLVLNNGFNLIYEHLVSMDFNWRLRLRKGREDK